jgi:formate/nitrite transporter
MSGRFDALLPPEMAEHAERVGIAKCRMGVAPLFVLAVLAGAFIALGAMFSTTVIAGADDRLPYGVLRVIAGLTFSLGLVLVVVGGAELFTGNNLIVMAWASRAISSAELFRNWAIVFAGNLAGAVGTAALVFAAGQYRFGHGVVGATALAIAEQKSQHGLLEAFTLGVLCNTLVCLAVWLSYSARSTADRILAVLPPITAFVACGFEHSVANMYFVPIALLIRGFAPASFWQDIHASGQDYPHLSLGRFLLRDLPAVTLGNVVGGAILVGAVYWFVYLRGRPRPGGG